MVINKNRSLKNTRVLITAGPTWVPIDGVRVISNVATAQTGILLAQGFKNLGAEVTLLLGPVEFSGISKKIKIIRFRFFDELRAKITQELRSRKFHILIHSAAVSDYGPSVVYRHKVDSHQKNWQIKLAPLPKIIDAIKKIDPSLFLVGFKFEPGATKETLMRKAKALLVHAGLDLAVANSIDRNKYRAYILNGDRFYGPLLNKRDLSETLIRIIGDKYGKAESGGGN